MYTIRLHNTRVLNTIHLAQLIRTLHSKCCHFSLNKLILRVGFEVGRDNDIPVSADILKLLCFSNLTILSIHIPLGFKIGNPLLKGMAVAWPRLQMLFLGSNGWGGSSEVTLQGLIFLLQRCRLLTGLVISIDASIDDYSMDAPPSDGFNDKIRLLMLADSKITDSMLVAEHLSPSCRSYATYIPGMMAVVVLRQCRRRMPRNTETSGRMLHNVLGHLMIMPTERLQWALSPNIYHGGVQTLYEPSESRIGVRRLSGSVYYDNLGWKRDGVGLIHTIFQTRLSSERSVLLPYPYHLQEPVPYLGVPQVQPLIRNDKCGQRKA